MVDKDKLQSKIVVNATALDQSGALSILKQFFENIPNDGKEWLIFISEKIEFKSPVPNVILKPIPNVKSLVRRFIWDWYGLNKWLRTNQIKPLATISLQNTNFRVSEKNIPRFIYYHQSIPFYKNRWCPLKKSERTLWFYKYVYPFFVSLFLRKDDYIFVQLDFIKRGFIRKFSHPGKNIGVFSPSINSVAISNSNVFLDKSKMNLFFPATLFPYKNHELLVKALKEVDNPNIQLYFTVTKKFNDDRIKSLGILPYKDICNIYENCDALVFPSFIETFGLPLIEAATMGLPIITVDLPYAREVLNNYEGAIFLPYDKPEEWAIAINKLVKEKRYTPLDTSKREGWTELFKKINDKL
ncbi:MAG: glycosyltransferase family 4 protein [Bacteroides sp.]|nr:glycosyltransferase family 4 protein [Bacteroides sp.]